MATFGERFKLLRTERQLTQDALAELFFLNKSSISRYESGKQLPEPQALQKFADFFNVSLDYLMGTTPLKQSNQSSTTLSEKNERDIAKDVDAIITKIESGEDAPLYYNGAEMDSNDLELFRDALQLALRTIRTNKKRNSRDI